MKNNKYELGYTPANLRLIMRDFSLSRAETATMLNASTRGLDKWCLPLESKDHRDMPAKKWKELLDLLHN